MPRETHATAALRQQARRHAARRAWQVHRITRAQPQQEPFQRADPERHRPAGQAIDPLPLRKSADVRNECNVCNVCNALPLRKSADVRAAAAAVRRTIHASCHHQRPTRSLRSRSTRGDAAVARALLPSRSPPFAPQRRPRVPRRSVRRFPFEALEALSRQEPARRRRAARDGRMQASDEARLTVM